MNIYTFKTTTAMDAFMDWLNANVGKRYRIIRRTKPRHNRFLKKRDFHSEVLCKRAAPRVTGWAPCGYLPVYFECKRAFFSWIDLREHPPFFQKRVFHSRYWNGRLANYFRFNRTDKALCVITIDFDSAADMVLCKMLWHDKQGE